MGDYTDLEIRVKLRSDVPAEVLRLLEAANDPRYDIETYRPLPDHELFSTSRWDWIVSAVGTSGEYAANGILVDGEDGRYVERKCSLKNYDSDIEKFLDWLSPFVDSEQGSVVGRIVRDTSDGYDDVVYDGSKLVLVYQSAGRLYGVW